jgi:hypothetical protein
MTNLFAHAVLNVRGGERTRTEWTDMDAHGQGSGRNGRNGRSGRYGRDGQTRTNTNVHGQERTNRDAHGPTQADTDGIIKMDEMDVMDGMDKHG